MQVVTIAVIKGGTGKTTTAAAIAQAAAAAGDRVLAIDLDPQANLTFTLGADQNRIGSYELITAPEAHNITDIIQATAQGLDVVAASPDLATLKTTVGSANRLKTALEPLTSIYDLVVVDTPPTMGELTYNALQASTGLIVPLAADTYSLQGLYQITDIASQMSRSNPALKVLGVIITQYDNRPKLNRHMRDLIIRAANEVGAPYITEIRSGIAIHEAQALRQSLYNYAPRSKPAADYITLYKAIKKAR